MCGRRPVRLEKLCWQVQNSGEWFEILSRSETHRCTSSGVSVFVDGTTEDARAQ
jgi:hypothetical protein